MNKKVIISKSLSDMLKFVSCLLVAFSHYYTYVVIEKQMGGGNLQGYRKSWWFFGSGCILFPIWLWIDGK